MECFNILPRFECAKNELKELTLPNYVSPPLLVCPKNELKELTLSNNVSPALTSLSNIFSHVLCIKHAFIFVDFLLNNDIHLDNVLLNDLYEFLFKHDIVDYLENLFYYYYLINIFGIGNINNMDNKLKYVNHNVNELKQINRKINQINHRKSNIIHKRYTLKQPKK